MKFCLIADVHLDTNDRLGVVTNGVNSRVGQKLRLLEKIVAIALEEDCEYIIELGDTFNRLNPPDFLRYFYAGVVKHAVENGLKWIRILGNHETTGDFTSAVGMDVSLLTNKYTVVAKPTTLTVDKSNKILFMPEIKTADLISEIKLYRKNRMCNLIFGHFGVTGAIYSNGTKEKEGVSLADLKGYDEVFLGHIHKHQDVGTKKKVHYVGCFARANFGDKDASTGYYIFEIKGNLRKFTYGTVDDIQLYECIIRQKGKDLLEPEFIQQNAVVKLVYEGTKDWFSGQDVIKDRKDCIEAGASKVFIDFRKVDDTVLPDQKKLIGDFNPEKMIVSMAGKNKSRLAKGLEYYRGV